MLKRTFTILYIFLFIPVFVYGQNKNVTEYSKQLVDDNQIPANYDKSIIPPSFIEGGPVSIGVTTNYDYFSNTIVRDQVIWDPFLETVHFENMCRPFGGGVPTVRHAVHTFDNFGTFVNTSVINAQSGWPHIDISLTGSLQGTVGMVLHTPNQLAIWDGLGGYIVSQFSTGTGTDPSLQFIGENIYLATSGNIGRDQFQFFLTTDAGISFTNYDSISAYSPSPIFWLNPGGNGSVEVGMSKSPNEQYFGYFGAATGAGHVYDPVSQDSADNVWMLYSNDGGSSWLAGSIGFDGVINKVAGYHTPNFAPLFENFSQLDAAVDNNGVWHFVANGYGLVFNAAGDSAIANSFPILYWNSVSGQWISISDPAVDTVQALGTHYPTNSIGQAYPSVSLSEDGQVVYVVWTGPQFTAGGELDTLDGGGGVVYFWRDLYHAYSLDGGTTWTYGGVLAGAGEPLLSEAFGHAGQHLQTLPTRSGATYRAHIVYLADLNTGVSLFGGGGPATDNPILYLIYDIKTTSVGDDDNLVNSFDLGQNYPNPFNPNTLINYTLAEKSDVTLKVYDVLGKEVATLVNTVKDAGSHEVKFDASSLSSGLYIYTIQAGSFTASKKMTLLK